MPLKDYLDLNKAYKRVQQDKRDDTLPDIVNYQDYERLLKENLEKLKSQIEIPNQYQAQDPAYIEIPKKGFTLRPVAAPKIDDRILYQAIADILSPHFHSESCVYSNKLSGDINSTRMFLLGVDLWLKFQDDVEKNCEKYPYVVETDITAYFEHISHRHLTNRIQDVFAGKVENEILKEIKVLLPRLWRRWNKRKDFGIPQVNDASSFFANLFLDDLDKWMVRNNYVFMRYVDDMRVFAEDEPKARQALAELITQLRERGLYIASGKTSIRQTAPLLKEMRENSRQMNLIEAEIKSGDPSRIEKAAHMLEDFIAEIIENPEKFNDKHFRFCVYRFKKMKVNNLALDVHEHVAEEVLRRLKTMPHSTDVFIDYLSLFSESTNVQLRVIEFLESNYNIYPYQEMLLLELLIRLDMQPEIKDRALSIARVIARSNHKDPACRQRAFVFWGKNGDYADRREIRGRYDDEPREDVRRAILFAIQEMQKGERDNFLGNVANESTVLKMTAQYIENLSNPKYHFYNPPKGFEISENWDSNDIDDLPMPSP
jgi:retron-type reverse transcriptase